MSTFATASCAAFGSTALSSAAWSSSIFDIEGEIGPGINSGFGREITGHLLTRGERVVGSVRRPEDVADLAAAHPDLLRVERPDVSDTAATRSVVDRTAADFGGLDVVVSNAGYGLFGAAEELSDTQDEEIIAKNLTGSIQLIRAAIPHLRRAERAGSSKSARTAARSPSPGTRCTTPPNGGSRASARPSRRRSRTSGWD